MMICGERIVIQMQQCSDRVQTDITYQGRQNGRKYWIHTMHGKIHQNEVHTVMDYLMETVSNRYCGCHMHDTVKIVMQVWYLHITIIILYEQYDTIGHPL